MNRRRGISTLEDGETSLVVVGRVVLLLRTVKPLEECTTSICLSSPKLGSSAPGRETGTCEGGVNSSPSRKSKMRTRSCYIFLMPAFITLHRYSIQTLSSISHLPPLPSFSLDNQESKSKERISTFALRLGRIHYSASGKTLSKSKPPLLLFSVRRRLDVLDTALYRGRMGGWMHEGDLSRLCYRFF